MLYNYNFSLPTAFIYVIFTIYFFFNPILPVKRNRNFILLLFFQGLTIFTDIWASILCNDYQLYSIAYVYIINMLYFVSFISRIYFSQNTLFLFLIVMTAYVYSVFLIMYSSLSFREYSFPLFLPDGYSM